MNDRYYVSHRKLRGHFQVEFEVLIKAVSRCPPSALQTV